MRLLLQQFRDGTGVIHRHSYPGAAAMSDPKIGQDAVDRVPEFGPPQDGQVDG
jgi:hypothetical protein